MKIGVLGHTGRVGKLIVADIAARAGNGVDFAGGAGRGGDVALLFEDADVLIEVERRAPIVVGDVRLVYDRAPDYFAGERLWATPRPSSRTCGRDRRPDVDGASPNLD